VNAVTDVEWLRGTDPLPMLAYLLDAGAASDRKLRLFGAACSRRVWVSLDATAQAAVEVAEAFAEGVASDGELRAARLACRSAGGGAAWYAAATRAAVAARNAALSAQSGARTPAEPAAQADLLRDLFGPGRATPLLSPPPTAVLSLARRAYDERQLPEGTLLPTHLGALADALEALGCADAFLLAHIRSPGPHVRGCFALDALLDRT
jgi:hypothetical protein